MDPPIYKTHLRMQRPRPLFHIFDKNFQNTRSILEKSCEVNALEFQETPETWLGPFPEGHAKRERLACCLAIEINQVAFSHQAWHVVLKKGSPFLISKPNSFPCFEYSFHSRSYRIFSCYFKGHNIVIILGRKEGVRELLKKFKR